MLVVAEPIGSSQKVRQLLVHASCSGETRVLPIEAAHNSVRKVHFAFDEYLLRIGDDIAFIDTESGKVLAVEPLEEKRHIGGRFFYAETFVWAAVYDYDRVRWHKVGQTQFYPGFAFVCELDCPIVYSYDFTHFQIFDGEETSACRTGTSIYYKSVPKLLFWLTDLFVVIEVETPMESSTPSSLRRNGGRRWFKLHRDKISEVTNNYASVLKKTDGQSPRLATTESVRNRMQGIAIVDGSIVLFRNASLGYAIDFTDFPQNQRRIVLRQFKSTSPYTIVNFERKFKVDYSPFSQQWTLKKAVLPQREAWLDSRGLLHLRAHDGSELSLVLHDNHVSGWHSDGSVFGAQYFTNRPDVEVPASVERWLKEFANP